MSIYLLVFMSIDRYLAIVHAVGSISSYRTTKNTTICIMYDHRELEYILRIISREKQTRGKLD